MRVNTTRAKLAGGGAVAGVIVPAAAPILVDLAGMAGFDYVLIDTEHGSLGLEAAEHLVRAAEAAGVTPLARAPHNHPAEILRLLEIGAQGVMVPQVNTAAEAEAAVRAAKYHPRGARGLAGSRAAGYGVAGSTEEYVRRANQETMVLALIEDVQAVEHLDAIMAVEGIDVLAIGPADLAQSMGYPGRADRPEVQAVIDEIIARGVAAGRVVGMNAPTAAAVTHYAGRGVRCFSLGPWHHLMEAWRGYVRTLEEARRPEPA